MNVASEIIINHNGQKCNTEGIIKMWGQCISFKACIEVMKCFVASIGPYTWI
jgi:hypothetical protein